MRRNTPDPSRLADPFQRMRLERRIAWGVFLFFLALLALLYGDPPLLGGLLP